MLDFGDKYYLGHKYNPRRTIETAEILVKKKICRFTFIYCFYAVISNIGRLIVLQLVILMHWEIFVIRLSIKWLFTE